MPFSLELLEEKLAQKSKQKPKPMPPEKMVKKAVGQRNWINGSMIGYKFGSLTVVGRGIPNWYQSTSLIPCKCSCGKNVGILANKLLTRKSCSHCSSKNKGMPKKHGKIPHDVYIAWRSMKARCFYTKSSNYKYYGGRGISVCERWAKSFENFLNDMGEKPQKGYTLERIDNNKDYGPENCRWATRLEQAKNKRSSILLTCDGESKSITEWSVLSGVKYSTIYFRLKNGWDAKRAVWFKSLHASPSTILDILPQSQACLEEGNAPSA